MDICLGDDVDKREDNENKIKTFIAKALKNKKYDVYNSSGKPSPSKLVALLKKETGIIRTRQTIATYLKDDLSSYTSNVDFSQNIKITEIKAAMDIARGLYEDEGARPADKTKAMNAWRQLNQQLIDYEAHLRELEIRKVEASRPNYLIQIKPALAIYKCSKCNYSTYIEWDEETNKWVEVDSGEKKKTKNTRHFESGDGQSTLEGDKKDEK